MIDENVHTRCTLLEKLGVHNANEYRRECPCHAKTPFGKLPPVADTRHPPGEDPVSELDPVAWRMANRQAYMLENGFVNAYLIV